MVKEEKVFVIFHPFDDNNLLDIYSSEELAKKGIKYWHNHLSAVDKEYLNEGDDRIKHLRITPYKINKGLEKKDKFLLKCD